MIYDRASKNTIEEKVFDSHTMDFLYGTTLGGICVVFLRLPIVSKVYGMFQQRKGSTKKIRKLVSDYDMSNTTMNYKSFNDFIIRKEKREFDTDRKTLIAPCDSCLIVNKIEKNIFFRIKDKKYTILQFVKNERWARDYEGGYALIFRLRVYDYHRFCYIDDGLTKEKKKIGGFLDSVNTSSTGKFTLSTNSRELSLMQTTNFGDAVFAEVGAMLVGGIVNTNKMNYFKKGDEKGYFEFGGSTIVILLKKDIVDIDEDILEYSGKGIETKVTYGERIGIAKL